jgi:hypothetical protein
MKQDTALILSLIYSSPEGVPLNLLRGDKRPELDRLVKLGFVRSDGKRATILPSFSLSRKGGLNIKNQIVKNSKKQLSELIEKLPKEKEKVDQKKKKNKSKLNTNISKVSSSTYVDEEQLRCSSSQPKSQLADSKREKLAAILHGNMADPSLLRELLPDPEVRQLTRDFEAAYNRNLLRGFKPTATLRSKICFARAALFCRQAGIKQEDFLNLAQDATAGWRKRLNFKVVQPWQFPYVEADAIEKLDGTAKDLPLDLKGAGKALRAEGFTVSDQELPDIISLAKISLHTRVESKYEKEIECIKKLLR